MAFRLIVGDFLLATCAPRLTSPRGAFALAWVGHILDQLLPLPCKVSSGTQGSLPAAILEVPICLWLTFIALPSPSSLATPWWVVGPVFAAVARTVDFEIQDSRSCLPIASRLNCELKFFFSQLCWERSWRYIRVGNFFGFSGHVCFCFCFSRYPSVREMMSEPFSPKRSQIKTTWIL